MRYPALLCGAVGLAVSAMAWPCQSHAAEPLQPYQLVRSLQLVQDRIASGDHAALPMQAKLLEMVDERLRTTSPDAFKEPRNFRALMVYGMSGGNPVTVEAAASRVQLDEKDRAIADGIIDYLNGRPVAATEALASIDPMQLPPDLGAFLALVKGSLLATEKPAEALVLLDKARLLSPGTLVEEAALRRSIAINATQDDAARFALASTQYVERYLYSPYASQFADAFVSGVIAMHEAVSTDKLADITSMMDSEREKIIYLRIARRAAIDGLNGLSQFASAQAEQGRNGKNNEDDPRAQLYASLSTMTSATVEEVRSKLDTIDRSRLSQGDQSLLDAARAVVDGIEAVPAPLAQKPVVSPAKKPETEPASAVPVEQVSADTDLPPVEGILEEKPATETSSPPPVASVSSPERATAPASSAPSEAAPTEPDQTDTAIADTRRKLESIDQILGESPG